MLFPLEDQHPLKQGLKQPAGRGLVTRLSLEDQHPLKQGLKHGCPLCPEDIKPMLEDQHPLKQGLKHNSNERKTGITPTRRPTSTKTRIETTLIDM